MVAPIHVSLIEGDGTYRHCLRSISLDGAAQSRFNSGTLQRERLVSKTQEELTETASRAENGKLIELVARREMPPRVAERLFDLYGLDYQAGNPDHSAPIYPYFLPAQAAHVIRTSVETA